MARRITYYIVCIFTLVLMLSSCISSRETNYLQTINYPYPKQEYTEYKLQRGDQIQCAIYTHDEYFSSVYNRVISGSDATSSPAYLIHHNGKILLPYFGEIEIEGLTVTEAEEYIQSIMREAITDVEVTVKLQNNFYYFLSDEGSYRGKFEIYKENMTIFQALAQAGGSADRTIDYKRITVVRKGEDGKTITNTFDLRTKDIIQSEFYYVYPNDMYYFPTSSKSFFNVTSMSSVMNTILTPVMFLIMVTKLDFK